VQRVARDDQLDECADRVCVDIQAHRSSYAHTQTRSHIYTDMMTDDIVRCKRTSICAAQAIVRYVLNSPSELIAAKYLGEIALRHALRHRCGTAQNRNPKQAPIGSDALRHIWCTIKRASYLMLHAMCSFVGRSKKAAPFAFAFVHCAPPSLSCAALHGFVMMRQAVTAGRHCASSAASGSAARCLLGRGSRRVRKDRCRVLCGARRHPCAAARSTAKSLSSTVVAQ
jgi:hypothetical protein